MSSAVVPHGRRLVWGSVRAKNMFWRPMSMSLVHRQWMQKHIFIFLAQTEPHRLEEQKFSFDFVLCWRMKRWEQKWLNPSQLWLTFVAAVVHLRRPGFSSLPGSRRAASFPEEAIYIPVCVRPHAACLSGEQTQTCWWSCWSMDEQMWCFFYVFVCVYSQHEEKERALKEQLSHLTALLPTLQVRSRI